MDETRNENKFSEVDFIEGQSFEYDEIECDLTTEKTDALPEFQEILEVNEDFESELPTETEFFFNREVGEFADISKYGIVEVAGDDMYGGKIITFSACRLPPLNEFSYERIFNYLTFTLDKYVTNDYVIVYFHYGLNRKSIPSLKFLLRVYKQLGRNYKKNIKDLFIVHPSKLINFIIFSFQKIVNSKFAKKIHRINHIAEMNWFLAIDRLKIPQEVKVYDNSLKHGVKQIQENVSSVSQFGVSLEFIYENHRCNCPPVVIQCIEYIKKFGLDHVGIFRRSANKILLDDVCHNINFGISVNFEDIGDVNLVSVILKRFFGNLEPALFNESFLKLIIDFQEETDKLSSCYGILKKLPEINLNLLFVLLDLLDMIQRRSTVNLMTSGNLGIVFGCNLFHPMDGLASLFYVNNFVVFLIDNYHDLKAMSY